MYHLLSFLKAGFLQIWFGCTDIHPSKPQTSPTPPLKLKIMQPQCACFEHCHSKWHSVVQGKKWVCVSGSNWDELVLIGLYEMFGVISVWALFWRAGSTLSWLGPLPSTAVPLHFLLFHSCARSLSILMILTFPASVIREWIFLFPPIAPPSQRCDLSGPLG